MGIKVVLVLYFMIISAMRLKLDLTINIVFLQTT